MTTFDHYIQPEDGTAAKHLPTWGNWQWELKYLPAAFHEKTSMLQLFKLARENWGAMDSNAELVVLSMGLVLRDIYAVHFQEEDEYPEDMPVWVQCSPHNIDGMHRLLEVWGMQLPAEENSRDDRPVHVDPKGKGKGKATGRLEKRKAKSAEEDSDTEQRPPA
jgi:hypothetical protein